MNIGKTRISLDHFSFHIIIQIISLKSIKQLLSIKFILIQYKFANNPKNIIQLRLMYINCYFKNTLFLL